MTNPNKQNDSCFIALAALLQDLGKFSERASVPNTQATDIEANTALAINLIKDKLPDLKGMEAEQSFDSFIDIASKQAHPESFLQWVMATADCVASGFEFVEYSQTEEKNAEGNNHYTARQITLMEQISPYAQTNSQLNYRYALKPLSVESLFPVNAQDCEYSGSNNEADKQKAQAEYKTLWDDFVKALDSIPKSHRQDFSLWLDHFDTLWAQFAHAIPATIVANIKPDVSLYDHSHTTAALSTALWRYHKENINSEDDTEAARIAMQQGTDWDENKFLLVQGDFFGIQNFIFSSGGETNKHAAKLLRGRSFYISLLTECAALKILQALELPATSQIINAAGKFLIVAPNTPQTIEALQSCQTEINQWFLEHSWGQAGVGFAWEEASCNDFRSGSDASNSPFKALIKRLFASLEKAKYQRFKLCDAIPTPPVFDTFLNQFNNEIGVCQIDGRSPAKIQYKDNVVISKLAQDQINIGKYLADPKLNRLMITTESVTGKGIEKLGLDIFGFIIAFTRESGETGHFAPLLKNHSLLRFWDFSLPEDKTKCLWNGYAKRAINGFVPLMNNTDLAEHERGKFGKLNKEDEALFQQLEKGYPQIKNLNLIACEDRQLDDKDNWRGISALTTLKGDIDNLGMIFQNGLGAPTFTKMAGLSRQVNAFFTIYLPWLCKTQFENTYTVFAGGDDFFLIGPWQSQIKLALKLQEEFKRYVANNDQVHFSVGLSTTKPGMPIRIMAEMGEAALEDAKAYNPEKEDKDPKNAVSCFSQVMFWDEFQQIMDASERLNDLSKDYDLSTGYLYGLLQLIEMAEKAKNDPSQSIWHSYFSYRTMRMLESKKRNSRKLNDAEKKAGMQILASDIAEKGIEQQRNKYRVALYNYLYQKRS